jgi:ABC-2 type transport system ATP-binding protein
MTAIELENVNKVFGRGKKRVHAVVDNTLQIAPGQVYGFLGPNGAGKTTLTQMLLDFIRPTSGTLRIFGEPVYRNVDVLRRVGTMIEGATFYPYLTGRKNLRILAQTHGLLQVS